MNIKTIILGKYYDGTSYTVTYKYWIEGDCECGANRVVRTFKSANPSQGELVESI